MRPSLMRSTWLALAVVLFAFVASSQTSSDVQKRVSPDEYREAPARIRATLKEQHCELPATQHWDNTRINIVSGHFADPAQTDWTAICIAPDGSTRALVFWGNKAPCPAEIRQGWALQSHFPPGQAGSLYLLAAPVRQILTYRKFFGDPNDNPVTHDGVEIGGEEASLIYYCYGGKWLELLGND